MLGFYTKPHQMTFVDPAGNAENASTLHPLTQYQVFFVLESDETTLQQVHVMVRHGPYGINLPAGNVTPMPIEVEVPPKGPGGNGLATVVFDFTTPAGGHGCLAAEILENHAVLPQNTDVATVPIGLVSNLSFLVFNPTATPQTITLKLTEMETQPTGVTVAVPPAQTWQPLLVAPADTTPTGPNPTAYELHLAANSYRSIGMQVSVPITAVNPHVFQVDGYVGTQFVNSVWRSLTPIPQSQYVPPDPYVFGGYQSPDIILRYPYNPADPASGALIPLGGNPGQPWDTSLIAGQPYSFGARVHNASTTPAINVQVYFWATMNGGVAGTGPLLDVQTVTIPAQSSRVVYAAKPFVAPSNLDGHKCAVISIYHSQAQNCCAAWPVDNIPPAGADGNPSCAAWRNTTARLIYLQVPWHLLLYAKHWLKLPSPVDIEVRAFHVPLRWARDPEIQAEVQRLRDDPTWHDVPLYLLPTLRTKLPPLELAEMKFAIATEAKVERIEARMPAAEAYHMSPIGRQQAIPFEISGVAPTKARKGDVLLVEVTAYYPTTEREPERAIQYLEILHVAGTVG